MVVLLQGLKAKRTVGGACAPVLALHPRRNLTLDAIDSVGERQPKATFQRDGCLLVCLFLMLSLCSVSCRQSEREGEGGREREGEGGRERGRGGKRERAAPRDGRDGHARRFPPLALAPHT